MSVPVSKTDHRALRALYEAGDIPVAELIRRSGLNQAAFYRMLREGGWTERRPRKNSGFKNAAFESDVSKFHDGAALPPAEAELAPPPPPVPVEIERLAVVKRAWAAADAQMREIELRLARLGTPDAADSEREARLMATLVKTLRDLVALDEEINVSGRKDEADAGQQGSDDLREELARRLARLRQDRRGA